jgi:colanic acid/amylovoran biosynthesis protein
MIIEIRKAGFVNKGAELMLHAVVQQVRARYPYAKITMAPTMGGGAADTFEKMQALKLYPKAWLWLRFIDFGELARFIPNRLLKIYGLVLNRDVDVVLDAAGFSYSDQWGVGFSRELAKSSVKWKANGTKLIMLPQAMGPFESNKIEQYVRTWSSNADLIFTRELDSYKYLTELVGQQEKIKVYPDFTNLIDGVLPEGYDSSDKRVAIVPNYRMIEKTSKEDSQAYLSFLIRSANYLVRKGAKPFLLVHEGANDQALAEKVSEAVGSIPIVKEADPLHIKGILGACDATVGSRFHGLASALSQGVPSLATGWSHKYQRLFEDYGFPEGLVAVTDSEEVLHKKLDLLIEQDFALKLRDQLEARSSELKDLSIAMWNHVFSVMDQVADCQRRNHEY